MTILSGYHLTEKIFEDSRSLIYRGYGESVPTPVIIKLLKSEYPTFSDLLKYRNQYTITKNLNLPGIIRSYSLERHRNGYALVMEDFGGISLEQWMDRTGWQKMGDSREGLGEFLPIALQITEILRLLAQNHIIHKDIKPQNLLINPETKQIKLTDFCMASLLPREQQELKSPYMLEGTLVYMSPEQTGRMNRGIDYRTDFYSTGITFYKMLTGRLPFESLEPMELVHCHIAQTPTPPQELVPYLPQVINDIVLKLMAKTPEERYQSALGLKYDLEQVWQQFQSKGKIEFFEIGKQDRSSSFIIPEKLYGRETQVLTLLNAFDRVSQGKTEIMLVSGFSGIGKTAVVNEVHKPIVQQRGYFIKGKFDQFRRNIPFSAMVEAFSQLMEQLLSESSSQLEQWKTKIKQALGENAQVIIEVIPELEYIIGKHAPVPELLGSAAQNRFNVVFEKFISVFTQKEHPLVIFLDDLQWADSASLKLIQLLSSEREKGYLLLIGSYRDNEVFPTHPLILTLAEIEKNRAIINKITLAPLSAIALNCLIKDTLNCSPDLSYPLTELVLQKTQGNPFFATQFLKSLHEDKLINFNHEQGYWQCDISAIKELAIADDIVKFMSLQIARLSPITQSRLKLAACLGNHFDLETLAIVSEEKVEEIAADLWTALQEGLILATSQIYKFYQGEKLPETPEKIIKENIHFPDYKFLHDRIQQAAYSLISEAEKPATHLKIGRLLWEHIPEQKREEQIFAIANHFNLGAELLTQPQEKIQLAQLNLLTGRKAKASTAYAVALNYLTQGIQLLPVECWQQHYNLSLSLYETAAEVASLTGEFAQMEEWITTVLEQSHTLLEQIKVYEVKIQSLTAQNKLNQAIETALSILAQVGIQLPNPPGAENMQQQMTLIAEKISRRTLEELVNAPIMTDPDKLVAMRILAIVASAAYIGMPALYPLIVLKQVELSLDYGNAPSSAYAYATYGLILCAFTSDIEAGNKVGELALQLLDHFQVKEFTAKVINLVYPFVKVWQYPLQDCLEPLIIGYQKGIETGDAEFAAYCAYNYCKQSYYANLHLSEVNRRFSNYGHGIEILKQTTALNFHQICYQSVLNWLGESLDPCELVGEAYNEKEKIPEHQAANDSYALGLYYINKLILCFSFGKYAQALDIATQALEYINAVAGAFDSVLFHFYDALTKLIICESNSASIPESVNQQIEKLERLAQATPTNFSHKLNLVMAERHRVLGNMAQAIEYYDLAIIQAKENQYHQEEALTNELAAQFYLNWGKGKVAQGYLQEAYYCYARWGAKAKIDDLERRYPQLLQPILIQQGGYLKNNASLSINGSSTSSVEFLDLATVIKASQLISGVLVPDHLIFTLMEVVLENAGAQKASLILLEVEHLVCVASCHIVEGCQLQPIPLNECQHLPISCINYVFRTTQALVIDDMTLETNFVGDRYIIQQQPKSVLCLPLIRQNQCIGVLYLENNLLTGAFTSDRIEILKVLCVQAAISFENANLYHNLQTANQSLQESLKTLQETQAELIKSTEKIHHDAFHDSLTNLPNRAWFVNLLEHTIELTQLHPQYLYAVLFIDIDRFKIINESLGHAIGDEFLNIIAERLQSCVRRSDTVARFGGDEFAILLEELTNTNEAIDIVKRIQEQIALPFNWEGYELFTTASIGIALSTNNYQQAVNVIRDADTAMYHAKAQGKNRYAIFEPAMQARISTRLQLESELRRAIENQEFCLHYQPIIVLRTGHLRGFEALVRWNHPKRGRVSPAEFIPIAEETGLISPLGWWVLEQACYQLSIWLSEFPNARSVVMNVNLSAIQLQEIDLLERLETILVKTGIPRDCLKLEITESCILETFSSEAKRLKELKDLGVRLSIDDFGTGYSSLSRLHEFPIDTLKIDRSFVHRLNTTSRETIQMIVSLAHSLGMDVVAEGIETEEELEILRQLGCEFGQGYLFCPPVEPENASQWFSC